MSDEDRITRVARALCAADGQDPEEMVHLGVEDVGTAYNSDVMVPAWTSYVGEARRMIAAVRAMGLVE